VPDRPLTASEQWILALLLTAALCIRLAYVFLAGPAPVSSDASGYDAAARRLVETGTYAFPVGRELWSGDRVREDSLGAYYRLPPNAWSMPGYPSWVASLYRLFGTGPDRFVPVLVVQVALSVVRLALCFWIARSLLGNRAALLAVTLNVLYPPNTWTIGYLLTETLFTVLLMTQIALMIHAYRSRGWLAWTMLGVATAAAGYVRPVGLPVPAALVAMEIVRWLRGARPRASLAPLAARGAACALVIAALMAPWALRNQRLYGALLPTTSAAPLPPLQGELFVRGIYAPETFAQFADLTPDGHNDHRFAKRVSTEIRSALPPPTANDWLRYQRIRARMLLISLVTPFKFPETPASQMLWASALKVVMMALALVGMWRFRRDLALMALLVGVPAYFVGVHWWVANLWPRYVYPTMPLVLILAAGALVGWRRSSPKARARVTNRNLRASS
jgi:hypothetical protein